MMNANKETSRFLAQIQSLEEELQRCRIRREKLRSENGLLSARSCSLEGDRRDMEQLLPHYSAELEEQLQELQERRRLQQLAHTGELQALKLQLHQEKLQLQEKMDLLSSEVKQQAARMKEQQEQQEQLKQQLPSEEQLLQRRSKIQSAEQQLHLDQKQCDAKETQKRSKLLEMQLSEMMEEKKEQLREAKEKAKLLLEQNKALLKEKDALQVSLENLCSDEDEAKANMRKDSLQILSLKKDVEELRRRLQLLKTEVEVRRPQSALQLRNAPRKPLISPMKHQRPTPSSPPAVEGAQRRTKGLKPQTTVTPPPTNIMTNSPRPPRAQIYDQELLEVLQRRDHQSP